MNNGACRARARKIVAYLKRAYPRPKSELAYRTQFQFLIAVILSAQCTDKAVNKLTGVLFKNYKRQSVNVLPGDFNVHFNQISGAIVKKLIIQRGVSGADIF